MMKIFEQLKKIDAFKRSVLTNALIYFGLIVISGIFNFFSFYLISILLVLVSTVLISINVLYIYHDYSENEHYSLNKILKLGLMTGIVAWLLSYFVIFLPFFISSLLQNSSSLSSGEIATYMMFAIAVLLMTITFFGTVMSGLVVMFSPVISNEKPDLKYFLTISGLFIFALIQVVIFFIFIYLPLANKIIYPTAEML